MSLKLWLDQEIPILGVSGGFDSGKTTFLLSIAGPTGKTLVYDLEMSSATYQKWYPNMTRVDLPALAAAKYPNGYTEKQLFEIWRNHLRTVKAGEYDVIAVDTLDALETGLEETIAANHKAYGSKSEESLYSHGKIWRLLRTEWNRILLGEIAAKCTTFAFSAHLKTVWKNNQPTREKTPAGKDVLMKLASLYLILERNVAKGQLIPSAIVHKSRLQTMVGGKLQQLLPPRLPEGTPDMIRKYIKNPPNIRQLSDNEVINERPMTADERLLLETEIADARQATAEAEAQAAASLERVEEIRDKARLRALGGVVQPTPDDVGESQWMELLEAAEGKGVQEQLVAAMLRDSQVTEFSAETVFPKLARSHYDQYLGVLERVQA